MPAISEYQMPERQVPRKERLNRLWKGPAPVVEIVPPPVEVVAVAAPQEPQGPTPGEQISRLEAQIEAIKAKYPDHNKEPPPTVYPKVAKIKGIVSQYYKVTENGLVSSSRDCPTVHARQVVMYLAKKLTLRSFPEIGRELGDRDHTTILHGFKKISLHKEELAVDLERLERAIATGRAVEGEPVKRWVIHKPKSKWDGVVVPFVQRAPRSDGWTSDDDLRLIELRQQGMQLKEIVRALGRTYEAIQTRMKRLRRRGVEILPHGKTFAEHSGSSA